MFKDRGARLSRARLMALLTSLCTALALLFLVAPSAHSASPASTTNATFGIGPANPKGQLDERPDLNYDVQPGSGLQDRVAVHNYSTQTLNLLVYAADALSGANGAIGYRPQAAPGGDASRWIRFVDGASFVKVTLNPGETKLIPITVTVPADASPGDHVAGVIASLASEVVGSQQKITLDQRIALRTYFRVGGNVVAQLRIEHLHVAYHNNWNPFGSGSASVSYVVHNTGNVILGGAQKIHISGLFGSTGTIGALAQVPQLLPGASVSVSARVKSVTPEFIMHAKVSVQPVGAPSTVNPGIHTESASVTFWAIPWMLLIIIGLIVAGVVTSIMRRRGPRRTYRGERRLQRSPQLAGHK